MIVETVRSGFPASLPPDLLVPAVPTVAANCVAPRGGRVHGAAGRMRVTRLAAGRRGGAGQRGRKLGPGADAQFAVGAGQVAFHGSLGDEQGLGDLPVGLPGRGQLRDAQFAGRQRVGSGDGIAAGPVTARA